MGFLMQRRIISFRGLRMLTIIVPKEEFWDERKEEFVYYEGETLELEHSLIAIRKWEQKWHKPFLKDDKTFSEILDYVQCMSLKPLKSPFTIEALTKHSELVTKIKEYIEDPMTATWFSTNVTVGASRNSKDIITAEIIYYWMIELGIPWEFERWHLRTLLTLIKTVDVKRQPKRKMDAKTAAQERKALNEMRKKKWKTNG